MTDSFTKGTLQADGSLKPEPMMEAGNVADAALFMAELPPEANVLFMTVMATAMPSSAVARTCAAFRSQRPDDVWGMAFSGSALFRRRRGIHVRRMPISLWGRRGCVGPALGAKKVGEGAGKARGG